MGNQRTVAQTSPFEFSGGALCLDFVNTLGDRPRCRNETLGAYVDLLRWAGEAGILDRPQREQLELRASRRPGRARDAFRRAIELREAAYRAFSAVAAGREPTRRDLSALDRALVQALPHLRLTGGSEGFRYVWSGAASRLDGPLWPVARSVAELLTNTELGLVRECASDRCSWLFLDRSRTRRRRWCDMKTCGNRAKARRHYARSKKRR